MKNPVGIYADLERSIWNCNLRLRPSGDGTNQIRPSLRP